MRRSILRHFVGNRDQLVEEAAVMIAQEAGVKLEQTLAVVPIWADARRVAESLIPVSHLEDPLAVFDVLINEAGTIPRVAALVTRRFSELANMLADWLRGWSGQAADSTARALLALRRQVVCRRRLGDQDNRMEVIAATELLVQLNPRGEMPIHETAEDVTVEEAEEETRIGVND